MSWKIARQGGRYRIRSMVSDVWLTEWISRIEALKFIYDDRLLNFKKEVIEQYCKFPSYWASYDEPGKIIIEDDRKDRYLEWLHNLSRVQDPEIYLKIINDKYDQIMKELEGNDE